MNSPDVSRLDFEHPKGASSRVLECTLVRKAASGSDQGRRPSLGCRAGGVPCCSIAHGVRVLINHLVLSNHPFLCLCVSPSRGHRHPLHVQSVRDAFPPRRRILLRALLALCEALLQA